MGNIYGVANPLLQGFGKFLQGGTDISCPAATETTIFQWTPFLSPSPGRFYPWVMGLVVISMGGTPPGSIVLHMQVNGGANVANQGMNSLLLVANANVQLPFFLSGPLSDTAWFPNAGTLTITCNPAGQTVTCRSSGAIAQATLFRGPDS